MCLASSPLIHGDTLLVSLATLLRCIERARSRSSSDVSVRICGLRNVRWSLRLGLGPALDRGERHPHRSPKRQRPGIRAVTGPVFVRQQAEAVKAPVGAPGILDDEPVRGISDDRKGVAADVVRIVWRLDQGVLERFAIFLDAIPAVMHIGGNVDRMRFEDCRLHVDDGFAVDAIIGAKRRLRRIRVPSRRAPFRACRPFRNSARSFRCTHRACEILSWRRGSLSPRNRPPSTHRRDGHSGRAFAR